MAVKDDFVATQGDLEDVVCCLDQSTGASIYDNVEDLYGVVKCPQCELVFVSPRLNADARKRFYDRPGYHDAMFGVDLNRNPKSDLSSRIAMRLQKIWIDGRLKVIESATDRRRLLEIGSSYGYFLKAAMDRGFDVEGVELSAAASATARERYGVTVHEAELESANLNGPYDVVCAWDTMEHVPDPVSFVRNMQRLIGPEGIIALSMPYFSSLPARLRKDKWWTLKPAEHIWHFTPKTLKQTVAEAGLHLTTVVQSPFAGCNFARIDSLFVTLTPSKGSV